MYFLKIVYYQLETLTRIKALKLNRSIKTAITNLFQLIFKILVFRYFWLRCFTDRMLTKKTSLLLGLTIKYLKAKNYFYRK